MPECAAIPGSQKRGSSASGLLKLSWRWSLPLDVLLPWGCCLWERPARSEGGHLCRTPALLLTGVHTTGRGPPLPAGVESCIYGYRRNFSMFFISSSVFLLNSCFHTHSCSEKCRGRNSSTPLTDFLQVKCSCLAVSFSHWPGVVCSRGAPPSMTVSISMTSIRPLGSTAVQSPIWFKNKGKGKTNKQKSPKSKQGGHTDTF